MLSEGYRKVRQLKCNRRALFREADGVPVQGLNIQDRYDGPVARSGQRTRDGGGVAQLSRREGLLHAGRQ